MCLVYDGFKDLYKVFADGEKIDSGTWTGDGVFEPARLFLALTGAKVVPSAFRSIFSFISTLSCFHLSHFQHNFHNKRNVDHHNSTYQERRNSLSRPEAG